MVFFIIISALFTLPHPVKATTVSNLLYASPGNTPDQSVGTKFNVTFNVANFDPFNGWDIHVRTNSSVIDPIALTTSGNYFATNETGTPQTELANCVDGQGTGCDDPVEGTGIIRSAVSYLGGLTASGSSGLLFTVMYVVKSTGYSDISIIIEKISNGSTNPVSHTASSATYGTRPVEPDLSLSINPPDISITLASLHSVSQNATLALVSINGLSGKANVSATVLAKTTLNVSFSPNQVTLFANQASSSTISVFASSSTSITQYFVNVTAVIGQISRWQVLTVHVNPIPDFVLSITPSLLKIHATASGSSTVTLDTQSGFSGSIHLKMDVPPITGLIASLAATDFAVSPGQPATTIFAVRTPPSDLPFKYLINITASSSQSSTQTRTITIRSPSPDFTVQISGPGFVVQAGQSRTYNLNASSVDYFRGQLFFIALSLSGLKESLTRPSVALDFGNSSTTRLTMTTDPFLAPGNHYLNLTVLGTTFLGATVNHTITETITVIAPPSVAPTILGLQPIAYFGVIGALWFGLVGAAIREIRKPKRKRFLT